MFRNLQVVYFTALHTCIYLSLQDPTYLSRDSELIQEGKKLRAEQSENLGIEKVEKSWGNPSKNAMCELDEL